MQDNILYTYYSDDDADEVSSLFRRNAFWMGKYDPCLNAASFTKYQNEKGFVFGIVGKKDGIAVSYIACYLLGGQRVCRENEIIVGVIVIDKKYRNAVFTLSEMFSLLVSKIVDLGYSVMISEVNVKNTPSLLMMNKTGFVLFDREPTIHNELILYNYIPALAKHMTLSKHLIGSNVPRAIQKRSGLCYDALSLMKMVVFH